MSLRGKAREIAHAEHGAVCDGYVRLGWGPHSMYCDRATTCHRAAMVAALEWARQEFGVRLDDYEHDVMRKQIAVLKSLTD